MKIVKVIHGYPMRYNAGSEVYSQTLCQALAERHEVHVFTREENSFEQDYVVRADVDASDPRIALHVVNNPRNRDRYRVEAIDDRFAELLERVEPDVVHVGHLNHLSTSLLREAAKRDIPIVYTLHDYWVMCPRGQFMQFFPEEPNELWAACDGQEDRKCAERCYSRYFGGAPEEQAEDVAYWTNWVARRMAHLREMAELVDAFLAPAEYLKQRYIEEFGLPTAKVEYLDYGFDRERLRGRVRQQEDAFTFGYIGTHIPAKGVQDLITAFATLRGSAKLKIWGRPRGQDTDALRSLVATLPAGVGRRISWVSEYRNQDIVGDVFNHVDAIVVPSIWVENSPLVIHEAQQVGVPVVTAAAGGMQEYVTHEVNGLLFEHRSASALAVQMQRFVDDPNLARKLGERGYLNSEDGQVPSVQEHVRAVEDIYERVRKRRDSSRVQQRSGPWRITFDTNPDTCNLRCVMCEEHSPHSPLQIRRKAAGRPRRVMPFELIERTVVEGVKNGLREIIPSTMGEPLLYDRFEDILALCERHGVKLNLTTNGTFPRLGAEQWARRIVPVTSDVKISWNGSTAATHEAVMQGANFDTMVDNVRKFISVRDEAGSGGGHRCRVTFQLTFLEANVAELADVVRLAVALGVDRLKGHHLWAHFDEIQELSMRRSPESIARWNAAVVAARSAALERTLPNGKHILLDNVFELDEAATQDLAPGGACPFLGQEAWVSATGRFDPCCAPDADRRTLGEFGNLSEQSLAEIWGGARYRELVTTYRNRSLCLSCNMRRPAVAP